MAAAIWNSPFPTLKLLFKAGANIHEGHLLYHVTHRRQPDQLQVLDWLVTLGLSVNKCADENDPAAWAAWQRCGANTPLHEASKRGQADVVAYLLEHGADANIRNTDRETALQLAHGEGHEDVVALLQAAR